jgi:hypothetical protein
VLVPYGGATLSNSGKVSLILKINLSAKDASEKTGIDNSSILKSCKSDYRKAGNLKWYYTSNS